MKSNSKKENQEVLTLLELAKSRRKKKPRMKVTQENYDLCVAWIKEEIGLTQVNFALTGNDKSGGRDTLAMIASMLKESYWAGLFKL